MGLAEGAVLFFIGLKPCLEKCHFQSYLSYFCSACFHSAKQFITDWGGLLPAVYFQSSQPTHTEVHYKQKRESSFSLQQQSLPFRGWGSFGKTSSVTQAFLVNVSFFSSSLWGCPFLPPLGCGHETVPSEAWIWHFSCCRVSPHHRGIILPSGTTIQKGKEINSENSILNQ